MTAKSKWTLGPGVQILGAECVNGRWVISASGLETARCPDCDRPSAGRHGWQRRCRSVARSNRITQCEEEPISRMMRGETRDAGHSARVRRADRMRFRSLSESVELQSDRHSRRWSFCRSYNRQSTPTAIGRCARDVDQQNRQEASSLGSHADL